MHDRLTKYIDQHRKLIEQAIVASLPPLGTPPEQLAQALHYVCQPGGKRIRPLLVLAGAQLFGETIPETPTSADPLAPKPMRAACAVELIHTYSLVHDDLPCMDNDDYRRGRLTCHKAFSEAVAVLVGDALHAIAFHQMTKGVLAHGIQYARATDILAEAVGAYGMVGGQVADLEAEGAQPEADRLFFIHHRKTGALLTASVLIGATLAAADTDALTALHAYGQSIGLAFQIVDDILDITSNLETLGKTTGKDQQSGKLTFPAVYGLEQSRVRAREAVDEACQALQMFGTNADLLREFAMLIINRVT